MRSSGSAASAIPVSYKHCRQRTLHWPISVRYTFNFLMIPTCGAEPHATHCRSARTKAPSVRSSAVVLPTPAAAATHAAAARRAAALSARARSAAQSSSVQFTAHTRGGPPSVSPTLWQVCPTDGCGPLVRHTEAHDSCGTKGSPTGGRDPNLAEEALELGLRDVGREPRRVPATAEQCAGKPL
jgi:hypothetical protein